MPPLAALDGPAPIACAVEPCACDREAKTLLSLDAAIATAASWAAPLPSSDIVGLVEAAGRVLAQRAIARLPSPAFDRSAMDGYALRAGDGLPAGARLRVVGRIAAGARGTALGAGEAARIFTGAPIPPGADAVVMQEDVCREAQTIVLSRAVAAGANVRPSGEDVAAGAILAEAGTRIDPRLVALLASQGIGSVAVRRRPRVAVLSTGDELVGPGERLRAAAIHDANRPMLLALLGAAGCETIDAGIARDDPDEQAATLRALAREADLIVTSGGASVGEEDHAARAILRAGGTAKTLAMALKPGKPAILGRIGDARVLCLPGNPVSALVVFMLLGRAMLAGLSGAVPQRPAGLPLPLAAPLARKAGRTEFVPALLVGEGRATRVALLSANSARLRPLVEADGFAEIPAGTTGAEEGELVAFHAFRGLLG